MELKWVIEHRDGQFSKPRDDKGNLNPYHHRDAEGVHHHTKRDNVKNFALVNDADVPVVVVSPPADAVVFQRRRVIRINYNNQFHTIVDVTPEWYDTTTGIYHAEKKAARTVPETTYEDFYMIGWRKRNPDGTVTVQFKAVYPDGKTEEYTKFGEKPWLSEPEWFAEELV
jgi:hypothetical protein